jgi:hypothetical protein
MSLWSSPTEESIELEHVWASIVSLPSFINKNLELKYLFPPLLFKETELEMHNLKCIVKYCGDNFDIKLEHCNPYAMIIGRQKNNVLKAIEFIKMSIKKCQQEMGN